MRKWQGMSAAATAMVCVFSFVGGCNGQTVDTDDDEDVSEAPADLDSHDGSPGESPADVCMDRCHDALRAWVDTCKTLPRPVQPDCVGMCTQAYGDCVRDCGWSRGGCNSLNSADCSPWGNP